MVVEGVGGVAERVDGESLALVLRVLHAEYTSSDLPRVSIQDEICLHFTGKSTPLPLPCNHACPRHERGMQTALAVYFFLHCDSGHVRRAGFVMSTAMAALC